MLLSEATSSLIDVVAEFVTRYALNTTVENQQFRIYSYCLCWIRECEFYPISPWNLLDYPFRQYFFHLETTNCQIRIAWKKKNAFIQQFTRCKTFFSNATEILFRQGSFKPKRTLKTSSVRSKQHRDVWVAAVKQSHQVETFPLEFLPFYNEQVAFFWLKNLTQISKVVEVNLFDAANILNFSSRWLRNQQLFFRTAELVVVVGSSWLHCDRMNAMQFVSGAHLFVGWPWVSKYLPTFSIRNDRVGDIFLRGKGGRGKWLFLQFTPEIKAS